MGLDGLTGSVGHAAQYRPAGGTSSISTLQVQGMLLEAQILKLIEADPVGAAKSFLGRTHLQKYGWMLGGVKDAEEAADCRLFGNTIPDWKYPYKFELADVLLEAKWILAQLVAEECWGGNEDADPEPVSQELSPYTSDAFIDVWMGEEAYDLRQLQDPFEMKEHPPNVTVRIEETGEYMVGSEKPPEHGFREVTND